MIYIVEVPHEGRPRAWFAFDPQDFTSKVQAARNRADWIIYTEETPRQRLEMTGDTLDTPGARDIHADIFARADQYGWDTVLYRADYLLDHGLYQIDPVSELEAYVAAIAQDLKTCRVYLSDDDASDALYKDPLFQGRDGFYAHMALRDQLISLEVIADEYS